MKLLNFRTGMVLTKLLNLSAPLTLLVLLILLPVCAEENSNSNFLAEHPSPMFNRSLSKVEIMLPFDGYHRDFLGERITKLDQKAPQKKPAIIWSRTFKIFSPRQMIKDSMGGTWFVCYASNRGIYKSTEEYDMYQDYKSKPLRALVRLNPDNTISWRRFLYGALQDYYPVIVCKGAVVMFVKTFNEQTDLDNSTNDVSLECIDLEGQTVWRTSPVKVNFGHYWNNLVWRISDDRIMLATGEFNSGTFNIYSLSDGSIIETVEFPGWNSGVDALKPLEPIELPDKGWIGFQKDGIVRFDPSIQLTWKHNINSEEILCKPVISRNMLIFSTSLNLSALDLDTCEIVWSIEKYGNATLHGAEPDRDQILFSISPSDSPVGSFISINHDGKLNFSKSFEKYEIEYFDQLNQAVMFNDGSILYIDNEGLNLIDSTGSLIWILSAGDLGFSNKTHTIENVINYAPNGQMSLCIINKDRKMDDDYIVELKLEN